MNRVTWGEQGELGQRGGETGRSRAEGGGSQLEGSPGERPVAVLLGAPDKIE